MHESPCIDVCKIDPESGLCIGCKRTIKEISSWGYLNIDRKKSIIRKIKIDNLKGKKIKY